MRKVPYTNPTAHAVHVGNTTIPPGESRMVDESLIGRSPEAPAAEPENPLQTILGGTVDEIARAVDLMANVEELSELEAFELEGKARKGVLEAISARRLEIGAADNPPQE